MPEHRKNSRTKIYNKKSPTPQYGSLNFTYVIRKISFSQKILRVVAPSNTKKIDAMTQLLFCLKKNVYGNLSKIAN